MIKVLAIFILTGTMFLGGCAGVGSASGSASVQELTETDLYFGMGKPDGGKVLAKEWNDFVDQVVTPRFPDGLTVEEGQGQWRGADRKVAREESRVIVLIYESTPVREKAIEEIREEYKKREHQESVMRVSHRVSVGF